ncbi:MAG: OB-fold nucleic acid binding domain-containing protein [Clostridia bacterium]|nr:OB-fold nucleic acid binding domain-containing protein [Clostridia bacterium]
MKKLLALLLVMVFALSFVLTACAPEVPEDDEEENEGENGGEQVRVMSHADYIAAPLDSKVTVEAYVQAAQGWWEGKAGTGVITLYLQDNIGGYFAYELACSEENAAKLTPGTKIRITGYKAEFNGEVEIMNGTFEFLDENDKFVAKAYDVTSLLGTDAVKTHMNEFVSFKKLTVVASNADGAAFLYKHDGSGKRGDDLYFKVSDGENTYNFTVESYLTDADTDVYKYIESISVGDVLDLEGFLYWYEGLNPHITAASAAKSEGVMSYAEYMAAELDEKVVIEAYVQAAQGWWMNKGKGVITLYLQDIDGAYFAYEVACSEEDAAKLVPGTKVKISGSKATFNGEIEVVDGTLEFGAANDTYIAEAFDATHLLGTDEIIDYMNMFVSFTGLKVVAYNENGDAFNYKHNGTGKQGDDLYFKATDGKNTYTFTVESYLTGADTEVYKTVESLKVGDYIDMEGFLYWYEGMNPHITSVEFAKSPDAMTYDEYMAAELDAAVVIEAYVQAAQGWWMNKGKGVITLYLQDKDGAYFAYEVACAEEDAAKLVPGTKVKISGTKATFNGEIEVADGTFEFGNNPADTFIATATDVTDKLGTDDLIDYMNMFVAFKGLTVVASNDDGAAFLYSWDGSGSKGSDLYFNATDGTNTYTFTVESYLCGVDTEVYAAVEALAVGDVIDMEGFLYWYEGMNPHITSVTVVPAEDDTTPET